jgi:uncharacterized membrane protein SpoIIM required for sporulation
MREAAFIKQNRLRWEEFEKVIKNPQQASPDKLAELFIQITDDLSFARTQYPDSRTTGYLNELASKVHLEIYQNKREDKNRFMTFWKRELPEVMADVQKPLLYSLIIFLISGIVGAVSTRYDETFVRLILSDAYVNMTLENIKNGNPTNVYASSSEFRMFMEITINNVMVSFREFVLGVFASIGTGLMLVFNGIMVGTFLMFMAKEQQFSQAFPVIMLHGTIELASLVIAGAAGFTMGNSLLFPGTYSRLESFKKGAVKGLKVVMGLVPFFILAGFIESYITRYAFMHWSVKSFIITVSAVVMVYYFVIYPIRLKRHGKF